jgi:hypothetical protein
MTGEQARDVVLDAVANAHLGALGRALDVIAAWAQKGRPFNANSCRDDMAAAAVPTPVIGRAFADARRRGLIRHTGYVTSTDPGTHARPISQWIATSVPEPVMDQSRDDRGRFDAPLPTGQLALDVAG